MGRRHHYVPRFYLRAFECAPGRIHLHALRRALSVANASLRDQCYSHRLYGRDDGLEKDLATFEASASRVFGEILAHDGLPKSDSSERRVLLTFIAVQFVTAQVAAPKRAAT